jgi:hypothetical protein
VAGAEHRGCDRYARAPACGPRRGGLDLHLFKHRLVTLQPRELDGLSLAARSRASSLALLSRQTSNSAAARAARRLRRSLSIWLAPVVDDQIHGVYATPHGRSIHGVLKMRAEMIQGKRKAVVPKLAAHTQKINLLADKDWLDLIDEYRKRQGFPTPTRSDAIRRLVDQALEVNGIKPKHRKPKG